MDLNKIAEAAINAVKLAGKYIAKEREQFSIDSIESKGKHDFVSYVDKGAEKILVEGLGEIIPESGFIAEEGTNTKRGDKYNWIIDPLDGTTNFIHGSPPYSISVALMEDNEIIMGIIFEITLGELFHSYKGAPAFLNNQIIKASSISTVADSLIATGFPYNYFARMEPFMKTLEYFFQHSHGVRRLGSAATDLAYVACGRYEAFYEYNLKPWDVAAGAFLVQQAGGQVGDFKGGDDYIFGGEVVASNSNIYNEFQQKVGDFMN